MGTRPAAPPPISHPTAPGSALEDAGESPSFRPAGRRFSATGAVGRRGVRQGCSRASARHRHQTARPDRSRKLLGHGCGVLASQLQQTGQPHVLDPQPVSLGPKLGQLTTQVRAAIVNETHTTILPGRCNAYPLKSARSAPIGSAQSRYVRPCESSLRETWRVRPEEAHPDFGSASTRTHLPAQLACGLSAEGRTCYEPLASTHPDTQRDGDALQETSPPLS